MEFLRPTVGDAEDVQVGVFQVGWADALEQASAS
jgi:hypothetical protein